MPLSLYWLACSRCRTRSRPRTRTRTGTGTGTVPRRDAETALQLVEEVGNVLDVESCLL